MLVANVEHSERLINTNDPTALKPLRHRPSHSTGSRCHVENPLIALQDEHFSQFLGEIRTNPRRSAIKLRRVLRIMEMSFVPVAMTVFVIVSMLMVVSMFVTVAVLVIMSVLVIVGVSMPVLVIVILSEFMFVPVLGIMIMRVTVIMNVGMAVAMLVTMLIVVIVLFVIMRMFVFMFFAHGFITSFKQEFDSCASTFVDRRANATFQI